MGRRLGSSPIRNHSPGFRNQIEACSLQDSAHNENPQYTTLDPKSSGLPPQHFLPQRDSKGALLIWTPKASLVEKNDSQVQVEQVAPGFFTLHKYHSDARRHEPVVGERIIQGRLNRHHQNPHNTVDHTEVDSHNHNAVKSGGHFGKDSDGEFYREKGRAS